MICTNNECTFTNALNDEFEEKGRHGNDDGKNDGNDGKKPNE